MTGNPWEDLARSHGPKCVASLSITDEELDALTAEQTPQIDALVRPLLTGQERDAVDFGCGAGRFTPMVASWASGWTYGADPCLKLLRLAPLRDGILYSDRLDLTRPCDIVFVWLVLGQPGADTPALIMQLASLLAPGALLVLGEHVAEVQPEGSWWIRRPQWMYRRLFGQVGVPIKPIGEVAQLENVVTVFAGRKR